MHKTVSVTIGGILFNVEESAYKRLEQYLAAIRAHFARQPESEEIVSDIEDRIAEEFAEKVKGRKAVITEKDIDELIANMGTVEDFEQFDAQDAKAPIGSQPWKGRLYRSSDDQILGGVCAGIAAWLGIDPTIVRLVFGISVFMGGFGVVLYILLWIILPEARTTAEKIEMAHGKVTLSAIQQRIDEVVPAERRRSALGKIVSFPFMIIGTVLRGIGKFLAFLGPLLARVIGFAVLVASALGIAFLTFVLLALLVNPHSPYIDFPLRDVVGQTSYALFLFSGYFLGFVPVLVVLLTGVSLLTLRSAFRVSSSLVLLGLWCAALVGFGLTAFTNAPAIEAAVERYETEHMAMTEKRLELENFRSILARGNTQVNVTKGPRYSVIVRASKDDIDTLVPTITDGVLQVERKPADRQCLFFCHSQGITLTVTMPNLDALELHGASHAEVAGFDGAPLRLVAQGSSHIEAAVRPTTLTSIISGASSIRATGSASTLDAELSGSSHFLGTEFVVQDAALRVNGASSVRIDARKSISGHARGSSHVYYIALPLTLEITASGASSVEKRDESTPEWW